MTGFLNTHGTCPNVFYGAFIDFQSVVDAFDEDIPGTDGREFVPIEELSAGVIDPTYDCAMSEEDMFDSDRLDGFSYDEELESFQEMADEAGIEFDYGFLSNPDARARLIEAWTEARYGWLWDEECASRASIPTAVFGSSAMRESAGQVLSRRIGPCQTLAEMRESQKIFRRSLTGPDGKRTQKFIFSSDSHGRHGRKPKRPGHGGTRRHLPILSVRGTDKFGSGGVLFDYENRLN